MPVVSAWLKKLVRILTRPRTLPALLQFLPFLFMAVFMAALTERSQASYVNGNYSMGVRQPPSQPFDNIVNESLDVDLPYEAGYSRLIGTASVSASSPNSEYGDLHAKATVDATRSINGGGFYDPYINSSVSIYRNNTIRFQYQPTPDKPVPDPYKLRYIMHGAVGLNPNDRGYGQLDNATVYVQIKTNYPAPNTPNNVSDIAQVWWNTPHNNALSKPLTLSILPIFDPVTANILISAGLPYPVSYEWSVLLNASVSGQIASCFADAGNTLRFDSITLPDGSTPESHGYNLVFDSGVLSPNLRPAGDFDSDGDVDGADFVAWQTHFPMASGADWTEGDADSDGDVDGADFVIWQTNFPFTPSAATVPEPSTIALALLSVPAFFALRRPRR